MNITKPPKDSFIAGESFIVSISIVTDDTDAFHKSFVEYNEDRICFSLDEGAYHTIVGPLRMTESSSVRWSKYYILLLQRYIWMTDRLINESMSSVNFTTVSDPTFHDPNNEYHDQYRDRKVD